MRDRKKKTISFPFARSFIFSLIVFSALLSSLLSSLLVSSLLLFSVLRVFLYDGRVYVGIDKDRPRLLLAHEGRVVSLRVALHDDHRLKEEKDETREEIRRVKAFLTVMSLAYFFLSVLSSPSLFSHLSPLSSFLSPFSSLCLYLSFFRFSVPMFLFCLQFLLSLLFLILPPRHEETSMPAASGLSGCSAEVSQAYHYCPLSQQTLRPRAAEEIDVHSQSFCQSVALSLGAAALSLPVPRKGKEEKGMRKRNRASISHISLSSASVPISSVSLSVSLLLLPFPSVRVHAARVSRVPLGQ